MKYKSLLLIATVLGVTSIVNAQTPEFYINGYGRSIITNNALETSSKPNENKVGGYALFDLSNNIKLGNTLYANAIFRVRNPFGGFFGTGTAFNFRQFQIGGKLGKYFNYELGDINVGAGMSPFAMNNFDDFYTRFESDIFAQRRQILEYENFNFGNLWRLQGIHANSKLSVGTLIDTVSAYGFVARTNSTDDGQIADRILGGGRLGLNFRNKLLLSGNYVGLFDIPVNTSLQVYKNNVLTGDIKYNLNVNDNIVLNLGADLGMSNFNNKYNSTPVVEKSTSDFYYKAGLDFQFKPSKVIVNASFKDVGPEFTSPTAQTRRINNTTQNALFGSVNGINRSNGIFDRYTNENQYNRIILPTFQQLNPIYSIISPYGVATPNRRGFTAGLQTDTSAKIINAEVVYDSYSQIVGENSAELRTYSGIKGGASFNVGKFIGSSRNYILQGGIRTEQVKRDGGAKIDLKNSIIDVSVLVEALKKVDLMFGLKNFAAKGNEIYPIYNKFNVLENYIEYNNLDISDNVISYGVRYRINKASHFTANYNRTVLNYKTQSVYNYNQNQFFVNFTISL